MSLPRHQYATQISDDLHELANVVKTRSRVSLTDANRILETIARRFFNALNGWNLVNLNIEQANFPAADLGDRGRRIAIQVTNEESSDKIKRSKEKASEHNLGADFDELIVFFLLPRKPGLPRKFTQPPNGPNIVTWDIADLLQQMLEMDDLAALERAAAVLREEMGKLPKPPAEFKADISRIIKYAPIELIGREAETQLLNDAWFGTPQTALRTPHLLAFVALGGEGKTSLVAKWAAELAARDWPGCDAVFAWSFYSQGTREQVAASSDLFLNEALRFFGDEATADSAKGAYEKGQQLARLAGERRALLILDGVEPLQYAPTSPLPGELRDQGLAALLKGLATQSKGLCVVTTRYAIPDLRAFLGNTVHEEPLTRLATDAGVALLKTLGVRKESGTPQEFAQLVEDVRGHALTLNLLGTYLRDAHAGDIRQRERIKLAEADDEEQGGHAFRVMDAYVQSLESGGKTSADREKGRRALALLQLLGLFDRPASADCLNALWQPPAIAGLTEPLIGLNEAQRNLALTRLEDARLLTVNRDATGSLVSLDAHPLLREYFAKKMMNDEGGTLNAGDDSSLIPHPPSFRAAHQRLYEHLCQATPDKPDATLEDLQPLYQAVAHGCQAGLQQKACDDVYFARIKRRDEHYSTRKLGAFGSDLGAVACFFETPWSRVAPALTPADQAWLLNEAAFMLRALGRLTESLEPMRAGLEMYVKQEDWNNTAIYSSNLSQLGLTLGLVTEAVTDAEQSVRYADRSGDAFQRISKRTTHADALHQAGRRDEAAARFREAEAMQAQRQPAYPLLYSLPGFRYCDLLLAPCERAAAAIADGGLQIADLLTNCRAVAERATRMFEWRVPSDSLLTIALDHLTLGRAALYEAILAPSSMLHAQSSIQSAIESAVSGLRRAGTQDELPRALLTRAWWRALNGAYTGSDSAQADLDEAWDIAARGSMRLHMADIHLYRARLFGVGGLGLGVGKKYPWESVAADLAAAEKLINECGYHRRDAELADAKAALGTERAGTERGA